MGWKRWDGILDVCERWHQQDQLVDKEPGGVGGDKEVPVYWVAPLLSQGEMQEEQVRALPMDSWISASGSIWSPGERLALLFRSTFKGCQGMSGLVTGLRDISWE